MTSGVSPLSSESKSQKSPLSDVPSPGRSPVQPESMQTDEQKPQSDTEAVESEEPVESHDPSPGIATVTKEGALLPLSPGGILDQDCGQMCNGTSPPPSPSVTMSHKRKRDSSPDTADSAQDG